MNDLKFSILIPTYNGGPFVGETLRSILSQSFTNYEIIVCDDASTDNTVEVIKSFSDPRIKVFKNPSNLGYSSNLENCRIKASGEVVYLMGQDDILGQDALLNTYQAFQQSDDIGAVTRPYFWFDKKITTPVRAKCRLNPYRDEIVTVDSPLNKIITMFTTVDQLSGLAYRSRYMDLPFHKDVFPCHVYPFTSIFKKHPVVFLKDYNIAVRIETSQTRSVSSVYNKSPLQSWVDMFNAVLDEDEFEKLRERLIKHFVATNFIGLVQIRNYARYSYLWREIFLLVRHRWGNIFNPFFWFFSLGCAVMPPFLLIPLVGWYKNKASPRRFRDIKFNYTLLTASSGAESGPAEKIGSPLSPRGGAGRARSDLRNALTAPPAAPHEIN